MPFCSNPWRTPSHVSPSTGARRKLPAPSSCWATPPSSCLPPAMSILPVPTMRRGEGGASGDMPLAASIQSARRLPPPSPRRPLQQFVRPAATGENLKYPFSARFSQEAARPSAPYQVRTITIPSSYHPRTCVAACSDFAMKSEHAATQVRGWYDDGTAQVALIALQIYPDVRIGT